jgi:germination protein M
MKAMLAVPAVALAASLGFLVASCGSDGDATSAGPLPSVGTTTNDTTEEVPASTTETTETTETGTETQPPAARVSYQVWFADAEGLFVTYRSEPSTPRVGTAALEALLEGPDSFEQDYGLTSAIPDGTQLLGLTIEDSVARVDLTSEFESGGGSASMQTRLAQVVYTITQFPTVKGVVFSLDGEPIDVLGGEGVVIDHPLTRRDYADLLPAILVTSPALTQTVESPVLVRGSANVFEANVGIQILDENDEVLVETFTTATCGTGCRGAYRIRVPFRVDHAQQGTIVVHDDDAAGTGTFPHEVRIPVRLLP